MKLQNKELNNQKSKVQSVGEELIYSYFENKGWKAFEFQSKVWEAYLDGKSGILNAPTGSGKTMAVWLTQIIDWVNKNPKDYKTKKKNGLQFLWITPLRSLSKDIYLAIQESLVALGVPWEVALRTGDVSASEKANIKKNNPEVIVTTPESLMLMLSGSNYEVLFSTLNAIAVDEWHDLLSTKRAVQLELAISRLKAIKPDFRVWGISATIGNLEEAKEVLLAKHFNEGEKVIIKSNEIKKISITSIIPETIEKYPWAGHLGIKLIDKVIPIIKASSSTLLFTNTRSQAEIWYMTILDKYPEFAGTMALHHGSIDKVQRLFVEEAIKSGYLKLVVCTSSLDLGVDFSAVETIIQIGSPKGVSRFLQRAGRSGHQPGAMSTIYFVPTNALELLESAAVKQAVKEKYFEERIPLFDCYDVLIQYLLTLSISGGFFPEEIFIEIKKCHAFKNLSYTEWKWILDFIIHGGKSLEAYQEFHKVDVTKEGKIMIANKKMAMLVRMGIGTIVSEISMKVQFLNGKYIGTVEESFISPMKIGDKFWFGGQCLELLKVKGMDASVKVAKNSKGAIPSWMGGRMPLSTQVSKMIKQKLDDLLDGVIEDEEITALLPILDKQREDSIIPNKDQFLIEELESEEGFHYFFFPFEGRSVHEGLSSLFAYRIGQIQPLTFSMAMNDYGFELLTDEKVDIQYAIKKGLLSELNLSKDISYALNSNEMAKRKFREIAQIAGLLFTGFPGKEKRGKHLQASSSLIFEVFSKYDEENLLLQQAYQEVLNIQLDEKRLLTSLIEIEKQEIVIQKTLKPTPFSFQIMVDRLNRNRLTSETVEDRVRKLQVQYCLE